MKNLSKRMRGTGLAGKQIDELLDGFAGAVVGSGSGRR